MPANFMLRRLVCARLALVLVLVLVKRGCLGRAANECGDLAGIRCGRQQRREIAGMEIT